MFEDQLISSGRGNDEHDGMEEGVGWEHGDAWHLGILEFGLGEQRVISVFKNGRIFDLVDFEMIIYWLLIQGLHKEWRVLRTITYFVCTPVSGFLLNPMME